MPNERQLLPHLPHLADVFVFADLSVKQPELIMPKRAH